MDPSNQQIFHIVVIAAIILVSILIYFIVTIIREQREVFRWQQQRIRAEIETLEQERKRIAADLHDELGPMLSAVKMHISHVEPTRTEDAQFINTSKEYVDQVIGRFREISYNLMPNTLVRHGLMKATEEFIQKVNGLNNLRITLQKTYVPKLPPEMELNLFRILQEIVHNTIKHAEATELYITFHCTDKELLLETQDNGKGFDYETQLRSREGGLGLLNLYSRTEVLNGKLEAFSAPGRGTAFTVRIPIEKPLLAKLEE